MAFIVSEFTPPSKTPYMVFQRPGGTICMIRMDNVLWNEGTDPCGPVQQSPKNIGEAVH
jgi:hypothetical protein